MSPNGEFFEVLSKVSFERESFVDDYECYIHKYEPISYKRIEL